MHSTNIINVKACGHKSLLLHATRYTLQISGKSTHIIVDKSTQKGSRTENTQHGESQTPNKYARGYVKKLRCRFMRPTQNFPPVHSWILTLTAFKTLLQPSLRDTTRYTLQCTMHSSTRTPGSAAQQ